MILCLELRAPANGTIIMSTSSQLYGVGTIATYSCDPGYDLVGETTRTCEDSSEGTVGAWSGSTPLCMVDKIIPQQPFCSLNLISITVVIVINLDYKLFSGATPDRSLIDCQFASCRYGQLVCPQEDNCTVNCYDSRQYACFETDFICPSRDGDCRINCDDSYACVQSNMTCPPGGNCIQNCVENHSCRRSVVQCSGDTCLLNCKKKDSCSDVVMECSSGNCTVDCGVRAYNQLEYSCRRLSLACSGNGWCNVYCTGFGGCERSKYTCSNSSNCVFDFHASRHAFYNVGLGSRITCENNSTCRVVCNGPADLQLNLHCFGIHVTCPRKSGDCATNCIGYRSCQSAVFECGAGVNCLTCTGRYSCSSAIINCQANRTCTINCDGPDSCRNARVTCPTGDYSCNIHCTNPVSCTNLQITNTHNVNLVCCSMSCDGVNMEPTSHSCPYIH